MTFINNFAINSGGAAHIDSNLNITSENIFINNSASSGDNINSYPSKFVAFYSENITDIHNFENIFYHFCNCNILKILKFL